MEHNVADENGLCLVYGLVVNGGRELGRSVPVPHLQAAFQQATSE